MQFLFFMKNMLWKILGFGCMYKNKKKIWKRKFILKFFLLEIF